MVTGVAILILIRSYKKAIHRMTF